MKPLTFLLLAFVIIAISINCSSAQEDLTNQSQPAGKESKNQAALEEQAYLLLEDVIAGVQTLKLPENRGRLEIIAADLLWKRDQGRARSLFLQAADSVVELTRQSAGNSNQPFSRQQSSAELRQELVLTAAHHEAALAYEVFQRTRPEKVELVGRRNGNEAYIEQLLLSEATRTNPNLALSKAEEMLNRGTYSIAIASVLAQLQHQDERAAAQLTEKILGCLQRADMLNNYDASSLMLGLLRAGPHTSAASPAESAGNMGQLNVSAYQRLLEFAVTLVLKPPQNTPAQLESASSLNSGQQQKIGDLLLNLRSLLPQIERYLPDRYQVIRQKINDLNNRDATHSGFDQLTYLTQQGASNNLLTAASTAPTAVRDRLYQQAAFKAVDEGNLDSARQIADEYLNSGMRTSVLQRIAAQQQLRKSKAIQLEDLRQTLMETASNRERVRLLLQLAEVTRTDNPKYSRQALYEAADLVAGRATSYEQLQDQLQVEHVVATVDVARSFELLTSGINQLNELLSAAATLSGFEVNIFVSSEMPLPGRSQLGAVIVRYGQELALLAKSDFRRAVATAEQFQNPEANLLARMSIVRAVLDEN